MWFDEVDTPIGTLTIAADERGLGHIEFPSNRRPAHRTGWVRIDGTRNLHVFSETRAQLREYFAGERREFDLPLAPTGTPFQLQVWRMLAQIPYGRTWSYRELAERIGAANAVRAVGAANGRNPLPIVLPCHRVIGADGSLTGFGGGLAIKAALLRLEGALAEPASSAMDDLFG